jgi:hypothetical protein
MSQGNDCIVKFELFVDTLETTICESVLVYKNHISANNLENITEYHLQRLLKPIEGVISHYIRASKYEFIKGNLNNIELVDEMLIAVRTNELNHGKLQNAIKIKLSNSINKLIEVESMYGMFLSCIKSSPYGSILVHDDYTVNECLIEIGFTIHSILNNDKFKEIESITNQNDNFENTISKNSLKHEYRALTDNLDNLQKLMKFLLPNNCEIDVKYKEIDVQIGIELQSKLTDFNIFGLLQDFYFCFGLDDTIKMVDLIKKQFRDLFIRFKRDYNKGTLRKAKWGKGLYKSEELRSVIWFTDNLLYNGISEFERFQKHFIKQSHEKNIDKIESTSNITKQKINEMIEKLLNEIDQKNNIDSWQCIFYEENDFKKYKEILANFFLYPNYIIPEITINTKNRTISKLSILFKRIHEQFSDLRGHLNKDERFHQIVRILHEWKDKNSIQIYKSIYKG